MYLTVIELSTFVHRPRHRLYTNPRTYLFPPLSTIWMKKYFAGTRKFPFNPGPHTRNFFTSTFLASIVYQTVFKVRKINAPKANFVTPTHMAMYNVADVIWTSVNKHNDGLRSDKHQILYPPLSRKTWMRTIFDRALYRTFWAHLQVVTVVLKLLNTPLQLTYNSAGAVDKYSNDYITSKIFK